MEQGNHGMMVSKLMPGDNPIKHFQVKLKELQGGFQSWLSKQSLPVEAAVVTVTSALQGAAIGGIMGNITSDLSSSMPTPPQASLNPQAMASLKQAQALSGGPLVQARNFAVMTGTNAGIACVMKRLRGKEDVQSRNRMVTLGGDGFLALGNGNVHDAGFTYALGICMVAAFGSGVMFSLVSGMGGPNPAGNALTSGFFFAIVQGGLFKVGEKFSQPPVEDVNYTRARSLLNNLGLQNYEKNFKNGLLTDNTLPLLTDSALRDVKIPPGPRLLILDHIQRDPELKKKH